MEVDYYSKYLKYKSKYTELKKQSGGEKCNYIKTEDLQGRKGSQFHKFNVTFNVCECNAKKEDGTKCSCRHYMYNDDYGIVNKTERLKCLNCNHDNDAHGVTIQKLNAAGIKEL
jgi:hypothetical protein